LVFFVLFIATVPYGARVLLTQDASGFSADGPLRTGPETGVAFPLPPGELGSIGTARVANYGKEDVRIDAVVPRVSGEVEVVGIRIMDAARRAPVTDRGFPPAEAVALDRYLVRPFDPSDGSQLAAIIVGVRVRIGEHGHIDGLDVHYRAGATRYQVFFHHVMDICGVEVVTDGCVPTGQPAPR